MADAHEGMRIEELAHRSGLAVDTIRFYQREGLLPAGRREGRTARYDAAHLSRLARIRELQASHLSLAAIRDLLDSSHSALAEAIFGAGDTDLTLGQLADAAGLPVDLVQELHGAGLLRDPAAVGRTSYDEADLRLLGAIASLLDAGMPRAVVVRLGEIYAQGFARLQTDVLTLFTEAGELGEDELADLQDRLTSSIAPVLRAVEQILAYLHRRTVQDMTVRAVAGEAVSARPAPGA